jgi:DNA segregation ATPase FtsK/SpoIIIE, S-DNA-T family
MARLKKKERKKDEERDAAPVFSIKPETARSIYAIVAGIFAILFLFAPLGIGGRSATLAYSILGPDGLFGYGYYLIPIVLTALTIGLVREKQEEDWGITRLVGAALLFLSGIALMSLSGKYGGFAGDLIASPFLYLFDYAFSFIILMGVFIIAALLALDTPLGIPKLVLPWGKKEEQAADIDSLVVTDSFEHAEPEPEEEAPDTERPARERSVKKQEPLQPEPMGISFAPVDEAYNPPPLSLLDRDKGKPDNGDIKANANLIKRTLQNFGITVEMDEVSIGPTVTRYALKPAEGVRLQKILGLQNNLELALAASPVRIEAPIPGKSLVGIEVPNTKKATVGLGSLLADAAFQSDKKPLTVALGRDITGNSHFANIAKMPHLLVAGATGSGKSVSIHALVTSLLYRNGPATLRFIMVDPKRVELTLYNPIPHLLTPVITDPKKAILSLKWAAKEMERRYNILEEHAVRDINSYHENVLGKGESKGDTPPDQMPYIVIIIDELADIMQTYPRELEAAVVRLAQMSRAVGIHLVLSTQRPSVNVITGLIKANVPARVALQVASQFDSRTILDAAGAEKLLGAGDMLFQSADMPKPHRIQTAFISESEVKEIVGYIKKHNEPSVDNITLSGVATEAANPIFSSSLEDDVEDDLFEEAKRAVEEAGKASTSYLQRKLRIGYSRAARLIDILEEKGVIGPADGARPRDVLSRNGGNPPDTEEFKEES